MEKDRDKLYRLIDKYGVDSNQVLNFSIQFNKKIIQYMKKVNDYEIYTSRI